MNIAIVGYGKMGHMIYEQAVQNGDKVVAVIDPLFSSSKVTAPTVDKTSLKGADVAIDFSHPSSAIDNICLYASLGIPAVVGTTGWYDEIPALKEKLKDLNPAIIYSGNFSMGVTAFMSIINYASKLMNRLSEYDCSIKEIHHIHKKDKPSGTALMISDIMLKNIDRKKGVALFKKEDGLLTIESERVGDVTGYHEVNFTSAVDEIMLSHKAFSRSGFASGALLAASWITDGRRGFFSMDDFANDLLGENI